MFCFGEELEDRKSENHFNVVAAQTKMVLFDWRLKLENIILAYEPVCGHGTGETASPEQAQEMPLLSRKTITESF